MEFIAGFFLSTVFLCAHIVDQTEFPLPNNEGMVEKNWYVHQLETTANFSNTKSFFSWFIGGLNYQIEHHLFPNICVTFITMIFLRLLRKLLKNIICLITQAILLLAL